MSKMAVTRSWQLARLGMNEGGGGGFLAYGFGEGKRKCGKED